MKTLFRILLKLSARSLVALAALVLFVGGALTARAQTARLQLSQLDYLAGKASETVDVNLDEHLMQSTAKFFSSNDPDDAAVKEVLSGIKGIYVKSFEFEHEGDYSTADVESIRSQLRTAGWTKIVGVISRKDGENVEVYLMDGGDRIGGLVVISTEPKELTVVNIIGPVDLGKLSKLEGQFGVPNLGIDPPKSKKK
jgi:hypothetical protein